MNTKDYMNLPLFVFGIIALGGVLILVGALLGKSNGMEIMRREAVRFGAAYYQSNTNTGEAVFTWRKGCE